MKKLTGYEAMGQWNPTYRFAHWPAWFKKKISLRRQLQSGYYETPSYKDFTREYSGWDHPGSIALRDEPRRAVFNMPYGDCDENMIRFANDHCMELHICKTSPWHPNARLYVFKSPAKEWTAPVIFESNPEDFIFLSLNNHKQKQ